LVLASSETQQQLGMENLLLELSHSMPMLVRMITTMDTMKSITIMMKLYLLVTSVKEGMLILALEL